MTQSGLVDPILGKFSKEKKFDRWEPQTFGKFSFDVLWELSKAIATTAINNIALMYLGFSGEETLNKRYDNIRNSELFNLAILELYATEKKGTPEVGKYIVSSKKA